MNFLRIKPKIIFTFFMICVIFFLIQISLAGCISNKAAPQETLYFSYKQDCPQCAGFKQVKSAAGTLIECGFCKGLGYVYQDPQGVYKKQ